MNTKKSEFIKYVEDLINYSNGNITVSDDALAYWEALKTDAVSDKPTFTDNGKLVISWMRDNLDTERFKSKDIADGLGITSRSVSGAMRKLVSDGFVEKLGKDPIMYSLTENGKNINID